METPSPPSNQAGLSPPPSPLGYIPRPLQTDQGEASLREIVLQPLIRGRRPQQHLEEDVATILGFFGASVRGQAAELEAKRRLTSALLHSAIMGHLRKTRAGRYNQDASMAGPAGTGKESI